MDRDRQGSSVGYPIRQGKWKRCLTEQCSGGTYAVYCDRCLGTKKQVSPEYQQIQRPTVILEDGECAHLHRIVGNMEVLERYVTHYHVLLPEWLPLGKPGKYDQFEICKDCGSSRSRLSAFRESVSEEIEGMVG